MVDGDFYAEIFHGERWASARCAAPSPVDVHCVSVWCGVRWWDFSINPRATTPWRQEIIKRHAISYVRALLARQAVPAPDAGNRISATPAR